MSESHNNRRFVFPRWANYLLPVTGLMAGGGLLYATVLVTFAFSPKTLAVGYAPEQPIHYSHALHAGKLGLDCRYCHTTVEKAGFAALPATQTCINCHTSIRTESDLLKPLRESWATGKPVEWTKVHNLPNFVYFNHSAHVNHGVGCVSCHGRIDRMEVVQQAKPLSMSWCLDCHREPEKNLRPKEEITNLGWTPTPKEGQTIEEAQLEQGKALKEKFGIRSEPYMTSCWTCHR